MLSHHIATAMINITPTQLRKAADIQEKIQELQGELGQLLGGELSTPAQPPEAPKKKRKMSAAGRKAIGAAAKARWAAIRAKKVKAVSSTAKATKAPKKKRKMTPAWRAALARAWAARRQKAKAANSKP
jgi:hypothetical protein